jgi:peptidoglycan-associated lipoprotein
MLLKRKWSVIWIAIVLVAFASGCKKKAPPPPPPPPPPKAEAPAPPPPAAPDISDFSAEPSSIERGQSSTLKWTVTGANQISIDNGVGTVQATGSRGVYPNDTTTYKLTANGPGGTLSKTATVSVAAPPPPAPPPAPKASISDRINALQDAYFDYDKSDMREDARSALTKDADLIKSILQDFPDAAITVEGHCDERGSAEYNLGLGDRRATAAKDFLVQLGVPADKLKTISYGKERPVCTESNEACWQRNRHAHFSTGQ